MVKVNEMYEIKVFPAEWNAIVNEYNANKEKACETILERNIAGESVRCVVTGYTWKDEKKPNAPLKQTILVQIAEIRTGSQEN